ncbi:hypothetical protein BJ165DRAFT_1326816, partial [Panaeolus papilionaceus]
VLIFVDDKDLAQRISLYLNSCLPVELRKKGVIRHYHSNMSEKYLQQAHEAFTTADGACRILVATAGQSVGVDFPDVAIVCCVGVPSTIMDILQRAGQALRTSDDEALFVLFYESWVKDISEEEFSTGNLDDPDRPRAPLHKQSKVQERILLSGIRLVQLKTCLRAYFSEYLGNDVPNALDFITI